MKTKNNYSSVERARQSFNKWNHVRIKKQKENPVDWHATVEAGKLVYRITTSEMERRETK